MTDAEMHANNKQENMRQMIEEGCPMYGLRPRVASKRYDTRPS